MSEIRKLMNEHLSHLESSDPHGIEPAPVVIASRRRRRARAALVTGAAVGVFALAGAGTWLGLRMWDAAPIASNPPLPSVSESPSPLPTPTPTPEESPVLWAGFVTGDDVDVLARLKDPTTGETWSVPTEIDDPGIQDAETSARYFEVGARGTATIVVEVWPDFDLSFGEYAIGGIYEVDGDEIRFIACPSARGSDTCIDEPYGWAGAARVIARDIHYDSLTYPAVAFPQAEWRLTPARSTDSYAGWGSAFLGYAYMFDGIDQTAVLAELMGPDGFLSLPLGDSALVETRGPGIVAGTVNSNFGIVTPFQSFIPSAGYFVSPWYGVDVVTWDDGKDSFTHTPSWAEDSEKWAVVPAKETCAAVDETLLESMDPAQWQAAGKHTAGQTVYLPVEGGNATARAVWEWMSENSWAEQIDPTLTYPYDTFDQFLDARSVFAWERPDGEWVLAIDSFARQHVYECA